MLDAIFTFLVQLSSIFIQKDFLSEEPYFSVTESDGELLLFHQAGVSSYLDAELQTNVSYIIGAMW